MKNSKPVKSINFAIQQIRRLKSKGFYPAIEAGDDGKPCNPGELELARVLHKYSDSDQHMERVIDAAVIRSFGDGGQDRCPGPSDVWQLCREINPVTVKPVVIDQNCPECSGYGYMIVQSRRGMTGAAPCARGCPVAGYQGPHDKLSQRALDDWYARELAGAESRRRAHIARQQRSPAERGGELLHGLERMAVTGAARRDREAI